MLLVYSKVLVLVCLLVLTFLASTAPAIFLRRQGNRYSVNRQRHKKFISLLSCFGGGVFLATCFLDLFPEVKDKFEAVANLENMKMNFPVAEFSLSVGFFIVLIIEQIALSVKESHMDHAESMTRRVLSVENEEDKPESYNSINSSVETGNDNPLEHSVHTDKSSHSKLRSVLLVAALSIHSIFEGLAIGLQSDTDDVFSIFGAVLVHKSIIAFSLGLNLSQSPLTFGAIMQSNVLFTITSPIGIAVGIGVTDLASGSSPVLISGILQGIACGTFLFVTFFEVLPHEFNQKSHRILKLFCVLLGFTCISIVILFHPSVPDPI